MLHHTFDNRHVMEAIVALCREPSPDASTKHFLEFCAHRLRPDVSVRVVHESDTPLPASPVQYENYVFVSRDATCSFWWNTASNSLSCFDTKANVKFLNATIRNPHYDEVFKSRRRFTHKDLSKLDIAKLPERIGGAMALLSVARCVGEASTNARVAMARMLGSDGKGASTEHRPTSPVIVMLIAALLKMQAGEGDLQEMLDDGIVPMCLPRAADENRTLRMYHPSKPSTEWAVLSTPKQCIDDPIVEMVGQYKLTFTSKKECLQSTRDATILNMDDGDILEFVATHGDTFVRRCVDGKHDLLRSKSDPDRTCERIIGAFVQTALVDDDAFLSALDADSRVTFVDNDADSDDDEERDAEPRDITLETKFVWPQDSTALMDAIHESLPEGGTIDMVTLRARVPSSKERDTRRSPTTSPRKRKSPKKEKARPRPKATSKTSVVTARPRTRRA